jgi:hypothetical protein
MDLSICGITIANAKPNKAGHRIIAYFRLRVCRPATQRVRPVTNPQQRPRRLAAEDGRAGSRPPQRHHPR